MTTEQLEDLELLEETPPTTPTEQESKKAVTCKEEAWSTNQDQAIEFVVETTKSVD